MIAASLVPLILLLHAAATWFMAGVIWFVQVVHYPLMARVGPDGWCDYERRHMRRTTWVVAPVMLIEAATAVLILLASPRAALPWAGVGLLIAVWVSTFAVQVPLHARLERGFDVAIHRRLVRSNWLRTLAWTARGAVAALMLMHA